MSLVYIFFLEKIKKNLKTIFLIESKRISNGIEKKPSIFIKLRYIRAVQIKGWNYLYLIFKFDDKLHERR